MELVATDNRLDPAGEIKAVQLSMEVLSRKWTFTILSSIYYYKSRRFKDLLKDNDGISNKQLSKELKFLETDNLVKRSMIGKHPWYELTEQGRTLAPVFKKLADWGRDVSVPSV